MKSTIIAALALAATGCATTSIETKDASGNAVTVRTPLSHYDLGRYVVSDTQRISQANVDRCVSEGETVFWQKLGNTSYGSMGVAAPLSADAFDKCMQRLGYRLK